jgi:hypothetical protein
VTVYLLFRTPVFQTWVSQQAASYLSKKLNAKITVGGVDIEFIKTVVLEDLYIEDQHQDTLLFAHKLKVDIGMYNLEQNSFSVKALALDQAKFHLRMYKGEEESNMQFIIDYFSGPADTTKKNTPPLHLHADRVQISHTEFIFHDENHLNTDPGVVNFSDIFLTGFNIDAENFDLRGNEIRAQVKALSLHEKSGFVLDQLSTFFHMTPTQMEFSRLDIETPRSSIKRYFCMKYDSIADMSKYVQKVRMYGRFENSKVDARDIAYFTSALSKYKQIAWIDGDVSGTVSDLKGKNIELQAENDTRIIGDLRMTGLPDIWETYMDFRFKKIYTNKKEVERILANIDQEILFPQQLENLGLVNFQGNFTGFISDFVTNGKFQSQIGNVVADINMKLPRNDIPSYSGNVETDHLQLGKLIKNSLFGNLTMNARIDGKGFKIDQLNTGLNSTIRSLEFKGHEYKNVLADGTIRKKFFEGSVKIDEKDVHLDFDGLIDFNDRNNPEFNFNASLRDVNLQQLNLVKDSIRVSTEMKVNFIGTNLDNLVGSLKFNATQIETPREIYDINSIYLSSGYDGSGKSLNLYSDLADAKINGDYHLSTIVSAVKSVMQKYAPSYDWGTINKSAAQEFLFVLNVKDSRPITEIFIPELSVPDQAVFNGRFSYEESRLRFTGNIPMVKYRNIRVDNLIVDGENDEQSFGINIASSKVIFNDSVNINNIAISNSIFNDSLQFNVKLADKDAINQLDLNGMISFRSDSTHLVVLPSEVLIDNQEWKIEQAFNIVLTADKKIMVNDFALKNGSQSIIIGGVVSNDREDALSLRVVDLDVLAFNQVLKKYNIAVQGILNADATITSVLKDPVMNSDLLLRQLVYNADTIGDLAFNSTWDRSISKMSLAGSLVNKTLKTVDIYGSIQTNRKNDNLDMKAILTETDLVMFEPFIKSVVSNVNGKASANLSIRGSLGKPEITGKLKFNNGEATVNYLKTALVINDDVTFEKDRILLENVSVKDSKGNTGIINGKITHQNFSDFRLDISMNARNFMCLNTKSSDNELYYGTAYASGTFNFRGPLDNVKIDINAKTEKGTRFFIPVSDKNSVGQQNYIRFIQKDSTAEELNYTVNLSGVTMNMNLEVNESAEVQMILDPLTGEAIKGIGNANLRLVINTLGNFEMYGTYEVSEGEYNFTLQNIITKRFKVEKGGTIRWNGDPVNARIDLTAYYETRALLAPLYASAGDAANAETNQRALAQCLLFLKNDLMSPDISFDLRFPENENIKSEVGGYLANYDNLNNQVASLLVIGRFTNFSTQTASSDNNGIATGLLSGQLSHLISTRYFDANLDNGVGGTVRLFNDRITIDGNFATIENQNNANTSGQPTTGTQTTNASSITGDVSVEYKISKDGRFRTKAFTRTDNNDDLLKKGSSQTESGLGLFYRIEFDTFGELFRKIFKKKEEELLPVVPPPDTSSVFTNP